MRIPLASTGLRPKDIQAAISVLNSGNLTMGSNVREFEHEMARYLKQKHFVFMNSGSSANLAMFEALLRPAKGQQKLHPGDGILVPSIAWPTTIWPIVQLGLKPVFVDVCLDGFMIDLAKAQEIINLDGDYIKGIFPIHPLGRAVEGIALEEFAKRNSLLLLNDVCESLGSWEAERHAGTAGVASSYSFYFSHHITTMEGGGVATDDDALADDLRSIRSHGWSRDRSDAQSWNEGRGETDAKFLFVSTGYNIRPMEIQAAIGLQQLPDLDEFVSKRRDIARVVKEAISGTPLTLINSAYIEEPELETSNSWMLIPLMVSDDCSDPKAMKIQIVKLLEKAEIETRPVLTGNFLSQPAMKRIGRNLQDPENYPNANKITEQAFLIGAHHDLSQPQISYLAENLSKLEALGK